MKMEVLAVQQQYQTQYGWIGGSNKVKDWTSTLTPPSATSGSPNSATTNAIAIPGGQRRQHHHRHHHHHHQPQQQHKQNAGNNTTSSAMFVNKMKYSINSKKSREENNNINNSINNNNAISISSILGKSISSNPKERSPMFATITTSTTTPSMPPTHHLLQQQQPHESEDTIDDGTSSPSAASSMIAVDELSSRLLDELRAAKSRHLTCTEVSLPCDLTTRIAEEIIRVSEKEPCGIRGCTIYIEFEDEPQNSRRIATLKLDRDQTVSTFEVYLTLRQDHRGWTALLPQFMKSLARTITISPEFTITKHKLYTPHQSIYQS